MFDPADGFDGLAISHNQGLTIIYAATIKEGQW
jgi:hypothetical protein